MGEDEKKFQEDWAAYKRADRNFALINLVVLIIAVSICTLIGMAIVRGSAEYVDANIAVLFGLIVGCIVFWQIAKFADRIGASHKPISPYIARYERLDRERAKREQVELDRFR